MVKVNGKPEDAAGRTLAQYLEEKSFDFKRVAAELNGDIVSKAQYDTTVLRDGDELEVVSFVGGG